MGLNGKEVLIVDDDVDLLTLLRKIFTGAGMTVKTASSVDQAIEEIAKSVPNIIMLDINLGEKTGFELLKFKSQNTLYMNIPVVMLSAYADQKHIVEALGLGATDYIVKPIVAKTILQKTRKNIRKANCSLLRRTFSKQNKNETNPLIDGPTMPLIKCTLQASIVAINELSVTIKAPAMVEMNTVATIDSKLLGQLSLNSCTFRSCSPSLFVNNGSYSTQYSFIGINHNQAQNIRKFCVANKSLVN